MEFNEKLQQLRKNKELTQEELAELLYVSRAAISKWESGRGYPNIDSLKAISKVFSISIDDLLSGDELLTIAEEEKKNTAVSLRNVFFGLLDMMSAVFFFIPLFGLPDGDTIHSVSLSSLKYSETYIFISFVTVLGIAVVYGILEIVLQNYQNRIWTSYNGILSLIITIIQTITFIISPQPYVAFLIFCILILKGFLYLKQR